MHRGDAQQFSLIRVKACIADRLDNGSLVGISAIGTALDQFPAVPFLSADRLLECVLLDVGGPRYQRVHTGQDVLDVLVREERRQLEIVAGQLQIGLDTGAALIFGLAESAPLTAEEVAVTGKGQFSRGLQNLVRPAVQVILGNLESADILASGLYDVNAQWKNLPMADLEQVVIRLLNPNRVAHVLGCRDTAVALAKRWGADVTDAARAGILHDITKALDGPLQLTVCAEYGKILGEFSRKYPRTLHALTGSMVAERIFGENEAVVSAIRSHTTGKADMNLLETIIYVADYMEPNRSFPGVEQLRELAFSNLTAALKLGLEMTLEHLKEQGNEVSPESREALDWLNRQEAEAL